MYKSKSNIPKSKRITSIYLYIININKIVYKLFDWLTLFKKTTNIF